MVVRNSLSVTQLGAWSDLSFTFPSSSNMNSQASPATPDPLATTLHNATIDKAERNEFSNSARDMFKIVQNNYNFNREGENRVLEFHDTINYLMNVVPFFVKEVHSNDQSRSTVGETTGKDSNHPVPQAVTTSADHTPHSTILEDPVDVIDIVPPEPSSLPVTSIADMYTRSMLKCLRGFPLYNPIPFCELSNEYPRNGVNVGDVGFVRGTGTFDFLFNICPPQNGFINPPNLADGFSLETPDHSATIVVEPLPPNTSLFQSPITKTRSGEYICEGPEGAVLELPKGAIQDEATNSRPFARLAARHGVQWYEYTMNRGRDISNGSLYLITSFTKCSQWGITVFDRPCAPGQGSKFEKKRSLPFGKSTSKYHWKGSSTFPTKISNTNQEDAANQCVFVRGYKIMIRQDIFDNLCKDQPSKTDPAIPFPSPQAANSSMTRQRATRIRGGGGPDPVSRLTGTGLFSQSAMTKSDEEVVLHPNFSSYLIHPSDLINAALLSQNQGAKVALTHDDIWCNLLRDNFPKLNYATLINIAQSYTSTIGYGMLAKAFQTYSLHYNHLSDCVSLEKVHDPSNLLEESSHPLQGTALEGSLTLPGDENTPVPYTDSLPFPRELVERILLLLDPKSLLKCRLVNREFNAIMRSSTMLQYYLACNAAGVIDNLTSPLSYAERLEALKQREDAWRKLTFVFETAIKPIDQPSMLYELTAGNYFLTDINGKDLYYCRLPSSPQDNPQWRRIAGHGPRQSLSGSIVETGMAVYEHDLIVNVISYEAGNQENMQRHSLDLILLKFSTGEYHPLARHPLIHLQRSRSARPSIIIRVAGDNLVLVVHDPDGSKLFIFDWKTGHKRLQHKASENAYEYSVPVFISPELLLVPNRILSHFEVWHLFPSHPNPNLPVQVLSLRIAAVSDNYSIISISCHGEPSPFLHSMPYCPLRPFFPSSEDSIIIVNLVLASPLPGRRRTAYKLIMHRRALLDMIQKWTSSSLPEQREAWSTNEVTVHKVADPDDRSVRLRAQSELIVHSTPGFSPLESPRIYDSPTLATSPISPTSPTSHITADSTSSSISSGPTSATSRYNVLQVQWSDWGPPISRWFEVKGAHVWWNSQSIGQRYVFLDPDPRDKRKCMIGVADFNVHNVKRNAEMMAQLRGEGEDNAGNSNSGEGQTRMEEELEILDHEGVFSEEVYMGLKCVVYHAPGEYDFDVVLMDEERLLGLKLDHENKEESIMVLYIG